MAGRIPDKFIDDLLDRTDIVEIIDSRVKLKKAGRNYTARCPFHEEKTPSFSVSPDKQFYHCFGCGASGNAIGFVMEYDHQDFPQAVETLARHAGLEVPREQGNSEPVPRERDNVYELMETISHYYQQQLRQPKAQHAVDYLKSRGLSGEICKAFGIGYAPAGWENLLNEFGSDAAQRKLLLDNGMLVEKEDGRCYDRFRDRIMFPIRDNRGRTIAFGGRVLTDEKPKYLNSPETAIFQKGRELYGLFECRRANRHLQRIIIVEGYMDVVALAQNGITNATATLGTATSAVHLDKVFRHCSEVLFCFDGDEAGLKAAERALETCLPLMQDGRQASFLFLPEGEDPDSLVRKIGSTQFNYQLDKATPLSEFLFEAASKNIDLSSMDGRAKLSQRTLALINRLPDGVFKHLMINALAERTGLDEQSMQAMAGRAQHQDSAKARPSSKASRAAEAAPVSQRAYSRNPRNRVLLHSPEHHAMAALLRHPEILKHIPAELLAVPNGPAPEQRALHQLIDTLIKNPDMSVYRLIGHWQGSAEGELYAQILASREDLNQDSSGALQELQDCLQHLMRRPREQSALQVIDQLGSNKSITFNELDEEEKQKLVQLFRSPEA